MASIGIMPREVRLVVLSVGLILAGIVGTTPSPSEDASGGGVAFPFGASAILVALGVITVGATFTTIQRILHVRNQAKHQATYLEEQVR